MIENYPTDMFKSVHETPYVEDIFPSNEVSYSLDETIYDERKLENAGLAGLHEPEYCSSKTYVETYYDWTSKLHTHQSEQFVESTPPTTPKPLKSYIDDVWVTPSKLEASSSVETNDMPPSWMFKDSSKTKTSKFLGKIRQMAEQDAAVPYDNLLPPNPISPAEQSLVANFDGLLDGISMEDVITIPEGAKPPKGLGKYELVPVKANWLTSQPMSIRGSAGSMCEVPAHVICNYGNSDFGSRKPFLDGGLAIGLTYKDELSAVATAYVTDSEALKIVQLQAVTAKANDPAQKFKSGLYGGFDWRESLVQAWIDIAKEQGLNEVVIQSASHNMWKSADKMPALQNAYDKVAERMGFSLDDETGDWKLPLA